MTTQVVVLYQCNSAGDKITLPTARRISVFNEIQFGNIIIIPRYRDTHLWHLWLGFGFGFLIISGSQLTWHGTSRFKISARCFYGWWSRHCVSYWNCATVLVWWVWSPGVTVWYTYLTTCLRIGGCSQASQHWTPDISSSWCRSPTILVTLFSVPRHVYTSGTLFTTTDWPTQNNICRLLFSWNTHFRYCSIQNSLSFTRSACAK